MKLKTLNRKIDVSKLFPCKAKDMAKNLLKLNNIMLKQGYSNSWHYKENGEIYPF